MVNKTNPPLVNLHRGDQTRTQLLRLIESDLDLTRTFMDIERGMRADSAGERSADARGHAAETRVRVLKAFDGLAALLGRAESLDMDVGAQRELLRQLKAEWESAA